MSKSSAASVSSALPSAFKHYKESATAPKAAHETKRHAIRNDRMISDLAMREKLDALATTETAQRNAKRAPPRPFAPRVPWSKNSTH